MTYNELHFISELVIIAAVISAWFVVKWIEKRLGCKNDWELLALIWRKVKLLWQPGPKR
jgi:hypothetical protein